MLVGCNSLNCRRHVLRDGGVRPPHRVRRVTHLCAHSQCVPAPDEDHEGTGRQHSWPRGFEIEFLSFSLFIFIYFSRKHWWFLEISKVTATTFRSWTNFVWFCSSKCLPNMKVLFKKDSFFPFKCLALVLFISCPASLKDSREESYYIFGKKILYRYHCFFVT